LLLTSTVLAPAALLAASFEGKVTFKMTSGNRGQPQEINYSIKGDKMRVEIPNQKGAMGGMIMDTTKKEMTMIMDEQKTYMVMALPQVAADAIAKGNDDVTLEKTGETDKILGYTATKYIVTSKDGKSDLWLAEGLGTFMGVNNSNPMGRGRSAPPPARERALAGKELFPLRVVGRSDCDHLVRDRAFFGIALRTLRDHRLMSPHMGTRDHTTRDADQP
jgi:hypothetical protein